MWMWPGQRISAHEIFKYNFTAFQNNRHLHVLRRSECGRKTQTVGNAHFIYLVPWDFSGTILWKRGAFRLCVSSFLPHSYTHPNIRTNAYVSLFESIDSSVCVCLYIVRWLRGFITQLFIAKCQQVKNHIRPVKMLCLCFCQPYASVYLLNGAGPLRFSGIQAIR